MCSDARRVELKETILPDIYKYQTISIKFVDRQNFECELKVDFAGPSDFKKWLECFKANTNTEWILRNKETQSKDLNLSFSSCYVCDRKSAQSLLQGSLSKKCGASISVKVRKPNSISSNEKPGAILKIHFIHNHIVSIGERVKAFKNSKEVSKLFIEYFMAGLTPSFATMYHVHRLICEDKRSDLRQLNPPKVWVKNLFQKWTNGLCQDLIDELTTDPNAVIADLENSETCLILPESSMENETLYPVQEGQHSVQNFNSPEVIVELKDEIDIVERLDFQINRLKGILEDNIDNEQLVEDTCQFLKTVSPVESSSQMSNLFSKIHRFSGQSDDANFLLVKDESPK